MDNQKNNKMTANGQLNSYKEVTPETIKTYVKSRLMLSESIETIIHWRPTFYCDKEEFETYAPSALIEFKKESK